MKSEELYNYHREIYSGGSANCFTGSMCKVMKLNGINIKEHIIYILGKGFKFYEEIDEFGNPKIFTKFVKMIDNFCEKYGIEMKAIDVIDSKIKEQIFNILKEKNIIVWLNSKYLKYSDFYYSQDEGYLHAITLEKIINKNLIRVIDSLIISAPVINCVADIEYKYLEKAILTDIEEPDIKNVTKKLFTLTPKESILTNIESKILCESLYENSVEILKDYEQDKPSAIMKFYIDCKSALDNGDESRKIWLLQRINRIIKVLWIIPNRKLLYEVILDLNLEKQEEESLLSSLEAMITNWLVLANCCLKCSIQTKKIDMIEEYFIDVENSEKDFWIKLEKILKRYI